MFTAPLTLTPPSQPRFTALPPLSLYIHLPWCLKKCPYCDFNSHEAREAMPEARYVAALMTDLESALPSIWGRKLSTIFFGGGTPTLLPAGHLGVVVREITETFGATADVEVTTEANPESVTPAYFENLRANGFTRVSIGMQSAIPHVLRVLDRKHRPGRPEQAVAEARAAGFAHVNVDLIYGAPYETEADWQASLDAAIASGADHVSAYALVVEEGTALARQVAAGVVPPPDDDVLADRYVQADETLAAAGLKWYEVSNWARTEADRCRHNELYWQGANWWGLGPGAHSHVGGVRWWNVKHPTRYAALATSGRSPAAGRELLDAAATRTEALMLGIRMRSGLALEQLSPAGQAKGAQQVRWGLLDGAAWHRGRAVLTQRGRLLADAVVRDLMG